MEDSTDQSHRMEAAEDGTTNDDDLKINGVIPIVGKHALRLPHIHHDFEVTSVEKTRHTDGKGDPIFTIRFSDRMEIISQAKLFRLPKRDEHTVVDIPPGMIVCNREMILSQL